VSGVSVLDTRKMVNGYQVNRKSGCRAVRRPVELSGPQGIRIIAILDAGFSLVRSDLNPPRRIKLDSSPKGSPQSSEMLVEGEG